MPEVYGSVLEGDTLLIKGTWIDADTGEFFIPVSLTFYLFNYQTRKILNSRTAVNLTPVATYVDANGVHRHRLTTADNAFEFANSREEIHVARYVAVWSAGAKTKTEDVYFKVKTKGDLKT